MTVFTPEDEFRIRSANERRAAEDRALFFDYFCDMAVKKIVELISREKESLLKRVESNLQTYSTRNTRCVPILQFRSFQQTCMNGKRYRRALQDLYASISAPGSYYTSLSGLHIVDLAAIYRNSDFRQRVNEAIGSDMFYITLTSKVDIEQKNVREYENTLWLNVRI
jgi:hypothetical protein